MKYQKNCKICNTEEWLQDAFCVAIVSGQTYEEIIEMFERHGISLNIYNVSVHKHRHLENQDLKKAEETKARWEAIDTKLSAKAM